jgi:type III secretion protein R
MDSVSPNILALVALGVGLGLIPLVAVTTTAFLKIAIVLFLLRNALGTQQTPPNLILYGVAIVLTIYVSAPLIGNVYGTLTNPAIDYRSIEGWQAAGRDVQGPIRDHLSRFTSPDEREFFSAATEKLWARDEIAGADPDSLVILIPSFVVSELTRAFEIGFLLYLPFIAIDLLISNVLMAMGMTMVSPLVISVPFKLLLFVLIDGWVRLLHGLVLSYG